MREGAEHRHRHVALATTAPDAASVAADRTILHPAGWSLLRMSVPARLVMVAAVTVLLWLAVAWALA